MSYPIRNNKLLREAYEAGRRQALSEQVNTSEYGELIAGPSSNGYSVHGPDANGHYWVVGPFGYAHRHKTLGQAMGDYGNRIVGFDDTMPGPKPTSPFPPGPGEKGFVPYQNIPPGYTGVVDATGRPMVEAYEAGRRQGLNEQIIGGGGRLPAGGKNQFQTQAPAPEGMQGGGDPNTPGSWFWEWLSQYGQLWFDLMQQGQNANWAQIPGFEPGWASGTFIWTTQQGTFSIYWNGTNWAGFPQWPFPE